MKAQHNSPANAPLLHADVGKYRSLDIGAIHFHAAKIGIAQARILGRCFTQSCTREIRMRQLRLK